MAKDDDLPLADAPSVTLLSNRQTHLESLSALAMLFIHDLYVRVSFTFIWPGFTNLNRKTSLKFRPSDSSFIHSGSWCHGRAGYDGSGGTETEKIKPTSFTVSKMANFGISSGLSKRDLLQPAAMS